MTTQEYVKKEAVEFGDWLRLNAVSGYDGCWDYNPSDSDQIVMSKTTSELFEIFLTERNEK